MKLFFSALMIALFTTANAQLPYVVKDVTAAKASPFPLQNVRLLESPFKHAMDMDAAWLLSLKPDRFLYRFRINAGLPPKDSIYGGWEARGVSGHSLGHYMSACAMMYAASGNEAFKQKTDYIINELAVCQQLRKTGYVGGIPDEDKIFNEVAAGDIRSQGFDLNGGWVPWYTVHKVFAGIIDIYQYTGNEKAKVVAMKFADWMIEKFKNLSEAQFQKMLDCEHGGMNEALANLYAITGYKKYLDLSYRFNHKKILDPLSESEDILPGKHANTQIPKIIGAARQYELTGDEKAKKASEFFWNEVVHHHSYVIGGNSDHEHFGEPNKLNDRLSTSTTETCNSYNMLKLTRHLFAQDPSASFMDYYERTLYNHILASQNPDDGMTCYYVPLIAGAEKTYGTPTESFWCCTGTGMENHVKYGESIFYQGADNSLYINLFIPSVLTVAGKYTVTMKTAYPEDETISVTINEVGKNGDFPIRIRYPQWAVRGAFVAINGKQLQVKEKPAAYIILQKKWRKNDVITIRYPMSLYKEAMPDNNNRIALLYGPLVLSGELGKEHVAATEVPVFVAKNDDLNNWIKPSAGKLLLFTAVAENRKQAVSLIPFYRMHHEHYAVYWDVFSKDQWRQKEQVYKAELERIEDIRKRTVDEMRIGEMQPERDHNLKGLNTETGEAFGRKWRHAVNGWFSFNMAVTDTVPLQMICTYWGSDGGREFDVTIDGVNIAHQKLEGKKPNEFMDVYYNIPASLVSGKTVITVRFQATPGSTAGGLFGCRIITNSTKEN